MSASRHLNDSAVAEMLRHSPMNHLSNDQKDFARRILLSLDGIVARRMRNDYYMNRPDRWMKDETRIIKAWLASR